MRSSPYAYTFRAGLSEILHREARLRAVFSVMLATVGAVSVPMPAHSLMQDLTYEGRVAHGLGGR
jgi:hypothetical protein